MSQKTSLPDLVSKTLNSIHANLTSDDNRYGHLFAVDRNQFWKAMNASYGYRSSAIRRAVIEGRSLYRTLQFWEQAAAAKFIELLTPEQIRLPREYADSCLRVLQGEPIQANLELRDRWADAMDALESPQFSPACLIVPAVLSGGIMAGARYFSEHEPDEQELETSRSVERGEIDDVKTSDHAYDYEASYWCSLSQAGYLLADNENRHVRLEFWNKWLADAVDVCRRKEEQELITDASIRNGKL